MPDSLYTTYIECEACFIVIWGQKDKTVPLFIENHMLQMKPNFDAGVGLLAPETLITGLLCCAKFAHDDFYYRTRITDASKKSQGVVEVVFIDFGIRDSIPVANVRSIYGFISSVISLPPQAHKFLLAKAQCINTNSLDFDKVSEEIRYIDCSYELVAEIGPHSLISLSKNGVDIADDLIAKNLVREIAIPVQQSMLQNTSRMILKSSQTRITPTPEQGVLVLTYKSIPLQVASEHAVYVTYVTDGPLLFSIQLKAKEGDLQSMMVDLNNLALSPFEEMPLPGCVCLALSSEDNVICRAVITNTIDNQFKVFFVDFGNIEIRSMEHLFQIPFKYVIPKVMATRFSLDGLEGCVVSRHMKVAFKDFVTNKLLKMRVTSPSANTALAMCELWDDQEESVLEHVRRSSLLGYPEAEIVSSESSHEVHVCYVFSCTKFYVQLSSMQAQLERMMGELQAASMQLITMDQLHPNAPCIAHYEGDGLFYRAQVLSVSNEDVCLKYVDYGNEETVKAADIRAPLVEFMVNLRPQAIECCLDTYQYMDNDSKRNKLLEELILEGCFTMQVAEIQNTRYIVDLFDTDQANVDTLLAEKLAKLQVEDKAESPPNDFKCPSEDSHQETVSCDRPKRDYSSNSSDRSSRQETSWNNSNGKRSERRKEEFGRENNSSYERRGKFDRDDFAFRKPERQPYSKSNDYNHHEGFKDRSNRNQQNGKRDFKKHSNSSLSAKLSDEHVDYVDLTQKFQYAPLQGTEQQVTISWFYNPMNFYSQLLHEKSKFDKMMLDIQYVYKNRKELEAADVGHSVIAVFPEDQALYRAIVLKSLGNKYKVFFVDFGNTATSNKVYQIERRFMEMPAQAVKCSLWNAQLVGVEWPDTDTLAQYFAKDSYSCNFIETVNERYYKVDLIAEQNSITQALKEAAIIEDISVKERTMAKEEELPECKEESVQIVPELDQNPTQETPGFEVELTHFDNPSQFYLVQSSAIPTIDDLQENLQTQIPDLGDIETVASGIICAAPFSVDNIWYRAQVLDADSDITTVRFIDYGNTDVLDSSVKIKALPSNLLSQEQHAKRCSLFLLPSNGEWASEACAIFEQLTNDAQLSATIVSQDEKTTFVRLYAEGQCINDVFVKEQLATEMQASAENDATGFVSHLNSPAEFWVQFEYSINDLEWIADVLTNAETFAELSDQTPGTLCASVFPDDSKWYRARILSNTEAGIEVVFIDYGNSCICTSLRELPEELLLVPPMAHKCKLAIPEGVLEWSREAADKFAEVSADGVTVFKVIKESQGETNLVKLLLNEEDVSQMLRPQLIDAEITQCASLGHISIRNCEFEHSFVDLQAKMQDLVDAPLADDVLVAVQYENAWYRAKLLNVNADNYLVDLIDVGLDVDVNTIRMLPEGLRGIEAMAKRVQVNPLPGSSWHPESQNCFRTLLENAKWRSQVEFINDVIVNLYLEGKDIRASISFA